MRSSKIVKEDGYLGHHSQILEAGDEQGIGFTESYPGTFNMTPDQRATENHDTTVSIYPVTK